MKPNYIVTLPSRGGHGVVVGKFILTAAHCIHFQTDGAMVLGDYFIELVRTRSSLLKVTPVAVEPVSDIAVLGCLDGQEFPDEAMAFEEFCESTRGIRLSKAEFALREPVPVRIHGHAGVWIKGIATRHSEHLASICVEADSKVEGGASGGPIVDECGALVAVISNFSVPTGACKSSGSAPRPLHALPAWICLKLEQNLKNNS